MGGDRPLFSWADYVVFGVVLSLSSLIGLFYAVRARKRGTTNEFMVANKQMGFFPVAMSLLASLFTGIFIQGTVSEVYFRGAVVPFCGVIPLLSAAYIGGSVFLPAFYKLEVKSVYQYLEMRFNITVRNCCLIIGYLYMILHCGIATFAASLVLTTVSELSFFASVMILSGVCTFYTAVGGIKAVLWADCFQMFLIFSPLVGAVIISSSTIGLGRVWEIGADGGRLDLFNFSFDPTEYLTFWTAIFGNLFGWMPAQCVLQYQVQRYITCKDMKTANIAYSVYTFGCFLIVMFCGMSGLCVYAQYVDCDPFTKGLITFRDELLPYFALDSFHIYPGVPGLLVSGLCSAALSTVSSVINSIVTISGEHIITKIWKDVPDSTYLLITKLLAVFFGILNVGVTYLMSTLGDIMPALIGLIGVTNGPVMGVFILGFLFPKCNSKVDGNKQKIDGDKLKPHTPFIAIIGSREDIFQARNLFYLVIEGSVVNDRIATFCEAVISLFSCFYTLSLEYPPEAAVTMEFIQRELIGINPEGPVNAKNGGKKKKKSTVAPKIVALLRGIMEFESDWRTDQ